MKTINDVVMALIRGEISMRDAYHRINQIKGRELVELIDRKR